VPCSTNGDQLSRLRCRGFQCTIIFPTILIIPESALFFELSCIWIIFSTYLQHKFLTAVDCNFLLPISWTASLCDFLRLKSHKQPAWWVPVSNIWALPWRYSLKLKRRYTKKKCTHHLPKFCTTTYYCTSIPSKGQVMDLHTSGMLHECWWCNMCKLLICWSFLLHKQLSMVQDLLSSWFVGASSYTMLHHQRISHLTFISFLLFAKCLSLRFLDTLIKSLSHEKPKMHIFHQMHHNGWP
jgi:hypothetical protein